MTAVWQQALALDAKFNAYRTPNNPQFSKNIELFSNMIYLLNRYLYTLISTTLNNVKQ